MISTGWEWTLSSWSAGLSSGFNSNTMLSREEEESPTEAMSEGTAPCCCKPVTYQCFNAASTLQGKTKVLFVNACVKCLVCSQRALTWSADSSVHVHHTTFHWDQTCDIYEQGSGVSPEGLSSWSLRYCGAQVDHLDFEDLWDVDLLSDRHWGP